MKKTKNHFRNPFNAVHAENTTKNGEFHLPKMCCASGYEFEGCCEHKGVNSNSAFRENAKFVDFKLPESKNKKHSSVSNKHKLPEFRRCACSICSKNYGRDCKYCLNNESEEGQSDMSSETNDSFSFEEGLFDEEEVKEHQFTSCSFHNSKTTDTRVPLCRNSKSLHNFIPKSKWNSSCEFCADPSTYLINDNTNGCNANESTYKPHSNSFFKSYLSGLIPKRNLRHSHSISHTSKMPESIGNHSFPSVNYRPYIKSMRYKPCEFCVENGQSTAICNSHQLRNESGYIACPILRQRVCSTCGVFGYSEYCPDSVYEKFSDLHYPSDYSDFYRPLYDASYDYDIFASNANNSSNSAYYSKPNLHSNYFSKVQNGFYSKFNNSFGSNFQSDFLNRQTFNNFDTNHQFTNPFQPKKIKTCEYCLSNGEPPFVYNSHQMRDDFTASITCPMLRQRTDSVDYDIYRNYGDIPRFTNVPLSRHFPEDHINWRQYFDTTEFR